MPVYGDDLSVVLSKEESEWYYTRTLDGKLTFTGEDYAWIKSRDIDGSFVLTIENSVDGDVYGTYFEGTFSVMNMEWDEDDECCVLSGLSEGVYAALRSGKDDEYDLMKMIPDTEAKEVQGEVWPALALVDYRSSSIGASDVYCGGASVAGGYKDSDSGFSEIAEVVTDRRWRLMGIYVEAKVVMNDELSPANGTYIGEGAYQTHTSGAMRVKGVECELRNPAGCRLMISVAVSSTNQLSVFGNIYAAGGSLIASFYSDAGANASGYLSPSAYVYSGNSVIGSVNVYYHYIRASLMTWMVSLNGVALLSDSNVLNMGPYYQYMKAFSGDGLTIVQSVNTSEESNGHRLIDGTDEYFAPPDDSGWIPLAEDNWNYVSMWYKITPSEANGLLDRALVGVASWKRCWTIGKCIHYLVDRISHHKVVFNETADYSHFLYDEVNPVEGGEQFQWLLTQKSNVMSPNGTGATRCEVRLNWFLELLKNAFNCYWWLESVGDGTYRMRIEHVEYFRRGGQYRGERPSQVDITQMKPLRNFRRGGVAAKLLSDQTNKYTYAMDGMVQKYTFSWQGEGGSDEFKGWPMMFKAGWIEEGTSEDHQVDNIFADLSWLMLHAGTDTESAKNYDGLFIFSAYHPSTESGWVENASPSVQLQTLVSGKMVNVDIELWVTMPYGYMIEVEACDESTCRIIGQYVGTGEKQLVHIEYLPMGGDLSVRVNYGSGYRDVVVHRIHNNTGILYRVPNTESYLSIGVYLQNGPLAWPSLQNNYLHYDVPSKRWSFNSDDMDTANFYNRNGSVKLVKRQTVGVVPFRLADPVATSGVRTWLGVGVIAEAHINLGSRNVSFELLHDIENDEENSR